MSDKPTRKFFEEGLAFATIQSGLVIRWQFKNWNGEINASRDGVSMQGVFPVLKEAGLAELADVFKEAKEVYETLAKDTYLGRDHRDAVAAKYKSASLFKEIEDHPYNPEDSGP